MLLFLPHLFVHQTDGEGEEEGEEEDPWRLDR